LPVAGTCAPIPRGEVTWVIVGEPGWYRVDDDPRDLDGKGLADLLAVRARAAVEAGVEHDVWIVCAKDTWWAYVV
ncbi:MAG: hypothetical protein ACC662_08175, partial [Planctomycetota bacterium]